MKGLPTLTPAQQQRVDQFHAGMTEMFDRYVAGVELDMNRHAVKHGPMPPERMVYDFTRVLMAQVRDSGNPLNTEAICGMLAVAISRGITTKKKGKS